ncbi:MAG: ComEA family DNA-binding protein [Leptolyngbyaceae cyanobacterium]
MSSRWLSPIQLPWNTWLKRLHTMRKRLQQDPFTRLNTIEEVLIAADMGLYIDVNQATADDWLRLPGISIHQAKNLVSLSHQGVVFYALEDIAAALGVPCRHLRPVSPLLRFCYYDNASTVTPAALSINSATIAQLMGLPGMSSPLAERILNERQRSPFMTWSNVHHRLRLSPEQTNEWMHYLTVSPTVPKPPPSDPP